MAAVSARRMRGPSEIGARLRHGADRGALRVGEAAFGADQDRGGAGLRRGRGSGSPPRSSAKNRVRSAGQSAQQRVELLRLGQLGQRGALALLGRFDDVGAQRARG